jgi:hypothetical protein
VAEGIALRRIASPSGNLLLPLLTQAVYSRCLRADAVGAGTSASSRIGCPAFHFQRTTIRKQRI